MRVAEAALLGRVCLVWLLLQLSACSDTRSDVASIERMPEPLTRPSAEAPLVGSATTKRNALAEAMRHLQRAPRTLEPPTQGDSDEVACAKLATFEYLGCDCTVKPGVDPCYTPFGCGCYCVRLNSLLADCPRMFPVLNAQTPPTKP